MAITRPPAASDAKHISVNRFQERSKWMSSTAKWSCFFSVVMSYLSKSPAHDVPAPSHDLVNDEYKMKVLLEHSERKAKQST